MFSFFLQLSYITSSPNLEPPTAFDILFYTALSQMPKEKKLASFTSVQGKLANANSWGEQREMKTLSRTQLERCSISAWRLDFLVTCLTFPQLADTQITYNLSNHNWNIYCLTPLTVFFSSSVTAEPITQIPASKKGVRNASIVS